MININKMRSVKKSICYLIMVATLIIAFPFWYEPIIVDYFGINTMEENLLKWEVIKGIGYALGLMLLAWQVLNTSRRADAAEKNAETALKANTEQRYHNAVSHLSNENESIRIGAIYNLYHISQSTKTYDETIFDMFCVHLKSDNSKMLDKKETIQISKKEKQIMIDKLFRVEEEKRIVAEPDSIDISGADLNSIDFSDAYLRNAKLTGVNIDLCIFDRADLTGATLPSELGGTKSMLGAKLDNIKLYTKTNMRGLKLQPSELQKGNKKASSLVNSVLLSVDLSNADLTEVNLTGANFNGSILKSVKGLTFEQLSKAKCLSNVIGLDEDLEKRLKKEKPQLFK